MDNIITENIINNIVSKLSSVRQINEPEQFNAAIELLFDGESELYMGLKEFAEQILNSFPDELVKSNIKIEFFKNFMSIGLLGFMAERTARDLIMDNKTLDIISRDYDSVEEYISKKLVKNKKSLKQIVVEESEKHAKSKSE
jgi:hypothetical protein